MSAQSDIEQAAADSKEAAGIMKAFAKGDATTQVDNGLEGGIPTLAKFIAEKDAEFQAALPDMVDEATDRAETAATNAEASAGRVDLGALDDAVAATAADVVSTSSNVALTAADRTQAGIDRAAADASAAAAAASADAAQNTKGIFPATAKALSKGVVSLTGLTAGSGGTNGTFALAFSGGAGSKAAGWFVVSGGAVTLYGMSYPGYDYTSAPTVSFAASSGLTGASLTAVISQNVTDGQYFNTPDDDDLAVLKLWQVVAGVAMDTGKRTPSSALVQDISRRVLSVDATRESPLALRDEQGYERPLFGVDGIYGFGNLIDMAGYQITQGDPATEPLLAISDYNGYRPLAIFLDDLPLSKGSGATVTYARPAPIACKVAAHRGLKTYGAPENSLDAVAEAAAAGFNYTETDVQRTSDGYYVICHDVSLDRTYRKASDYSAVSGVNIASNTLADLRSNYVMAASDPGYRRVIPTLQEYCKQCLHYGIAPLIELKDTIFTNPTYCREAVQIIVRILGRQFPSIASFYIPALDDLHSYDPELRLMYLYSAPSSVDVAHVAANKGILFSAYTGLNQTLVDGARDSNVPVVAWVVPNQSVNSMVDFGVDTIVTDMVAPQIRDQTVVHSASTRVSWDAFSTTGVTANGITTLSSGTVINLASSPPPVAKGAWYLSFELIGTATVTGPNLPTVSVTGTSTDNYSPVNFQAMLVDAPLALTISTTSTASIRNLSVATIKF